MAREDRPQYQHGIGTIGGTQFHWGSGSPGQYWSIPYGDYPVTPDAPTGAWAQSVGAIPIANNVIPDPQLGRNRIGIMIHSGSSNSLDQLYTQGCFKVAPSEWPAVRQEILAEAKNGPLYLHVAPGGVASFTNTKTMEQGSMPTAGAPGPPVTAGGGSQEKPNGSGFFDALSQIESNNRNIFSGVDKDYPGQPGSRSQGYFQIDTPTWGQFGAKAGIDLQKYPSAMNAPRDVQQSVASLIPLNRFGARTRSMLQQQFGSLDTSKTIGELAGSGAAAAAPSGQGGIGSDYAAGQRTPGTTINSTPAIAQWLGGAGSGEKLPGFPDDKTSDQFLGGLGKMDKAASGDQGPAPQAPPMRPPPGISNQSILLGLAPQIGQKLSGYTPQIPGLTLGQSEPQMTSAALSDQALAMLQQLQAMGADPYGGFGYG